MLETDYLVVGAGAAGMAITDELLTHTDADVTIVDRRSSPGGHWCVAYPFVRLHQPSAYYGVSSTPLGCDTIDDHGLNAGSYERAGPDEICAYYQRVLEGRFLTSGRVRWFPCHEFDGAAEIVSRVSGATTRIAVRRRIVDTTYCEGEVPATSPPPFAIEDGADWIPVGGLDQVPRPPERFVIVGAGKTALDACVYLLEHGVAPGRICWIKPREGRWLNRRFQQPLSLLPDMLRGNALMMEAMASAGSIDELFARLEAEDVMLRVDPDTPATFLRGAIVSESEMALLREIEHVVRLGHVTRIEPERIVLTEGCVPTSPGSLHVHCAARGLARRPPRPIFEPDRIIVQPTMFGSACYQFALLGAVEAMLDDDDDKNRLCRPIVHWQDGVDFLSAFLARMDFELAASAHPDVVHWARATRLNPSSGPGAHVNDPQVVDTRRRAKQHAPAAAANLRRLTAGHGAGI